MFDLLFLLVVGLSTAFAVLRGGLQEMATLVSLAVAAGLTWLLAPPLLGLFGLSGSFFGTIFLAGLLIGVFFIASHIACHLGLKRVPMNARARTIDRIGGGAFGLFRGLVLIGLGYLGYSYYLDEERQPDTVRNALTRPIAAGMANWFEGLAPGANDLDGLGAPGSADNADAAQNGYARADRNGLSEIVTTVTTTESEPESTAQSDDPIADAIKGEDE
ncbi:MAG: CvpA family protein [Pseudomonadota bacterium]